MEPLNWIQLVISILLMGAILLQQRGTGLSTAFGGEGNVYRTKRGLEKSLFRATVVLAVLFLGTALANTLVKRPGQTRSAPVNPSGAVEVPFDANALPSASPVPPTAATSPAPANVTPTPSQPKAR